MPYYQRHTHHSSIKTVAALFFTLIFYISGFSQEQGKTKVEIKQAGSLTESKAIKNAQRLLDNVILKHLDILMYCDSAYTYTGTNRVDAFGHVFINKADSLHLYANKVFYDGDNGFAQAIGNVKLEKDSTTLYTDTLDYDLNQNIGYYDCFGKIIDSTNTLTSKIGKYFVNKDLAEFTDSVVGYNGKYTINSENLQYNTLTKVISFEDSTTIRDSANTLYAEKGWYNTLTGEADLKVHPKIYNVNQMMLADHIKYNRANGNGVATGHAHIEDYPNKAIIQGNKVTYNKLLDIITATDSAVFITYNDIDSLYLHADTLKSIPDTIEDAKIIKAYYGVRFYRTDLQGVCDSMTYHTADSIIELQVNPVIWNAQHQIFADYIKMIQYSNAPNEMHLIKNSFITSQQDSGLFDQIKGRNMIGYIINNQLDHVDVDGNGQTLYYAYDEETAVGLNHAESSTIKIRLKEGKIQTIAFNTQPTATLTPIEKLSEGDKILSGFDWKDWLRPHSKNDIFTQPKRGKGAYQKVRNEHIIE
jgi:lipopolysaccharide export system protein LptA